jgi:hypothetical protein
VLGLGESAETAAADGARARAGDESAQPVAETAATEVADGN